MIKLCRGKIIKSWKKKFNLKLSWKSWRKCSKKIPQSVFPQIKAYWKFKFPIFLFPVNLNFILVKKRVKKVSNSIIAKSFENKKENRQRIQQLVMGFWIIKWIKNWWVTKSFRILTRWTFVQVTRRQSFRL